MHSFDQRLDEVASELGAWDGGSPRALAPALDQLERIILEARVAQVETLRAARERVQRWLALTAAGAVTLAQLIDLATQLDDELSVEAQCAGARLREAVGALAEQSARWLTV